MIKTIEEHTADIETEFSELSEEQQRWLRPYKAFLPLLRHAGVCQSVIRFSGSGDHGSVDDWDWYDVDNNRYKSRWESKGVKEDIYTSTIMPGQERDIHEWKDGERVKTGTTPVLVIDKMRDAVDEQASNSGYDWYNNDGGGGYVAIFLNPLSVEFYLYQNVVSEHECINIYPEEK